jgi:hypothetical protein
MCACGCGTEIPSLTAGLKPQTYAPYHHTSNKRRRKDRVNKWWARARAREIKGPGPCELQHITGCGGRLEVHHLDNDYNNNDPSNLMRLCICHHGLVSNGRIDLTDPVMPRFHVSGGKRRYEHTYRYVQQKFSDCGERIQ